MAEKQDRKTNAAKNSEVDPIKPDELTPKPAVEETDGHIHDDVISSLAPTIATLTAKEHDLIKAFDGYNLTDEDLDKYIAFLDDILASHEDHLIELCNTSSYPNVFSKSGVSLVTVRAKQFHTLIETVKPLLQYQMTRRAVALGFQLASAYHRGLASVIEPPMAYSHRALQTGRKVGRKSQNEKQAKWREAIKDRIVSYWKEGKKTKFLYQEVCNSLDRPPSESTFYVCLREVKAQGRLKT